MHKLVTDVREIAEYPKAGCYKPDSKSRAETGEPCRHSIPATGPSTHKHTARKYETLENISLLSVSIHFFFSIGTYKARECQ